MYVKITQNEVAEFPYSLSKLKTDYPNTVFPSNLTNSFLETLGIYFVSVSYPQSFNTKTHKAILQGNPVLNNNSWSIEYTAQPLTPEEIEQAERSQRESILSQRALLLESTDWYIIRKTETDIEVPAGILQYRQALRDITDLNDFPYVTLPRVEDYYSGSVYVEEEPSTEPSQTTQEGP